MIIISPKVKKHLNEINSKTIVLRFLELDTTCSIGIVKDVHVSFEDPNDPENYNIVKAEEEIKIFIDRRLRLDRDVVVKKQGFWKFTSFYVDGIGIPI